MRTDAIQVALRPRAGLEAVDLGFAMVRAWWRTLASTWLATVVPVWLVIAWALRDEPLWAIVVLWWLRPVFGRVPLHVLSRKLFGEPVDLRSTLAALPELARSGLLVSLVAQRLSPARTFLQPVLQLEGLRGTARRERSAILARQDVGAAIGLLSVGAHMNGAILLGVPMVLVILIPDEVAWRVSSLFEPLLDTGSEESVGMTFSLLYLLGTSVVEPLLVAGGFALYVNRRVFLEGWDIDLALRRLRERRANETERPKTGSRSVAAAIALLVLAAAVPSARADEAACRPGDPSSASDCIADVLASEDFAGSEERMMWTLKDFAEPDIELEDPGWFAKAIAQLFQIAGWAGLIGLLLALVVAVARRVEPRALAPPPMPERPSELFGLDLDPGALPEDLLGDARRAFAAGRASEAMSLLYRGALIRLVDHHGLAIPESATEYECVRLVEDGEEARPAEVFSSLTTAWVGTRYAAVPPTPAAFDELCEGFARAFQDAA